jgi:hypothetical protein
MNWRWLGTSRQESNRHKLEIENAGGVAFVRGSFSTHGVGRRKSLLARRPSTSFDYVPTDPSTRFARSGFVCVLYSLPAIKTCHTLSGTSLLIESVKSNPSTPFGLSAEVAQGSILSSALNLTMGLSKDRRVS